MPIHIRQHLSLFKHRLRSLLLLIRRIAGALAEEIAEEERERERIRKELIEDDDNVNEDNED